MRATVLLLAASGKEGCGQKGWAGKETAHFFFLRNIAYRSKAAISPTTPLNKQRVKRNSLEVRMLLPTRPTVSQILHFLKKQTVQTLKERDTGDTELGLLTSTAYPKVS